MGMKILYHLEEKKLGGRSVAIRAYLNLDE